MGLIWPIASPIVQFCILVRVLLQTFLIWNWFPFGQVFSFTDHYLAHFQKGLFYIFACLGADFEVLVDMMAFQYTFHTEGLNFPFGLGFVDFVANEEDAGPILIVVGGLGEPVVFDTLNTTI